MVVTAPGGRAVRAYATSLGADSVVQDKQLGTGHAAAAAGAALKDFEGTLVIAYGDMPLVTAETFAAAFAARRKRPAWPWSPSTPPTLAPMAGCC